MVCRGSWRSRPLRYSACERREYHGTHADRGHQRFGDRPVYIVHSHGDRRISVSQSQELAGAVLAAGAKVQLVPGAGASICRRRRYTGGV